MNILSINNFGLINPFNNKLKEKQSFTTPVFG